MTLFRWFLALLGLGFWAMTAWANGELIFSKRYRDTEQRPSMVMFMGGICAALGLWALPLHGPRARGLCLLAWLLMALLDAGTLGFLPLALLSVLGLGKNEGKKEE